MARKAEIGRSRAQRRKVPKKGLATPISPEKLEAMERKAERRKAQEKATELNLRAKKLSQRRGASQSKKNKGHGGRYTKAAKRKPKTWARRK